jgi:hypothetical protein
MNIKKQETTMKEQLTTNFCLWVRAAMCNRQQKQKYSAVKRETFIRPAAMQRHGIATNHL